MPADWRGAAACFLVALAFHRGVPVPRVDFFLVFAAYWAWAGRTRLDRGVALWVAVRRARHTFTMNNLTAFVDPCETRPEDRLAAVVFAALAALLTAAGVALIKRGLLGARWLGVVGCVLTCAGVAFQLVTNVYAPSIFVVPLFALVIPANFLLGFFNREKPDNYELMATTLIFTGCLFTSMAAAQCAPEHHDHASLGYYSIAHGLFILFWGGVCAKAASLARSVGRKSEAYRKHRRIYDVSFAVFASLLLALAMLLSRLVTVDTGLVAIVVINIIVALTAIAILILAISVVQKTIIVVPQLVAFTILFTVVGGGIGFGEFMLFTPGEIVFFVFGLCLSIYGCYNLVHRNDYDLVIDEEMETLT